jgi:glycosyltransferase involved in cell wall biosynthesis
MSSVSFVVPVFNKSSYLKHVVNSISSQKGDFDKEYIFIDDGSTDDSLKILKKETRKLKNCAIISQKNKGSANATNVGINLAKMKYIKFLDADDVILSNATFCLVNLLEKNQESVLAYGLQRKVENIKLVDLEEEIDFNDFDILHNPILLAMRNSMFNPSQFLVRREFCQKVGGCDERVIHSQEYSLTLRLSKLGAFIKINHPIAILPLSAPGQISEKKNNQIYRVSKALELFVKENKDLSLHVKLFATRRLTARSWRFARRISNSSIFSRWFLLYILGFIKFPFFKNKICFNANKIYEKFLD